LDKGPSLQLALPALEALHKAWMSRSDSPKYAPFHEGLNAAVEKIHEYYDRTAESDAYIMAMCMCLLFMLLLPSFDHSVLQCLTHHRRICILNASGEG
jgi:hypothetical protein